jgi:hypothetical protein
MKDRAERENIDLAELTWEELGFRHSLYRARLATADAWLRVMRKERNIIALQCRRTKREMQNRPRIDVAAAKQTRGTR